MALDYSPYIGPMTGVSGATIGAAALALFLTAAMPQGTPPTPPLRNAAVSVRLVWTPRGDAALGPASRNGRFIPFLSRNDPAGRQLAGRDLYIHDLRTGVDRRVTFGANPEAEHGEDGPGDAWCVCAFSPDGTRIAFTRWVHQDGTFRAELRVVRVPGALQADRAGEPELSRGVLFAKPNTWVSPHGWTPDGRWVLAAIRDNSSGMTQIAMLSSHSDSMEALKTVSDNALGTLAISPDGRLVAVEMRQGNSLANDIFVLDRAAKTERGIVVHRANDRLVGWAPAGHRLVFASDRRGQFDLFAVHDGAGPTEPEMLRQGIEMPTTPVGIAASGAVFYTTTLRDRPSLRVDSIDRAAGRFRPVPLERIGRPFYLRVPPQWSPDGRQLAYWTDEGGLSVVTRAPVSGSERTTRVPLEFVNDYAWASDARAIYLNGSDTDGAGAFRIDLVTGETERIRGADRFRGAGSGTLYFDRTVGDRRDSIAIIERNTSTLQDREVFRGPAGGPQRLALDPIARVVYYRRPVQITQPPHDLVARDLATGVERVILRRPLGPIDLSGSSRYVRSFVDGGWMIIPVDGSAPPSLLGYMQPVVLAADFGIVAQLDRPQGSLYWDPRFSWLRVDAGEVHGLDFGTGNHELSGFALSPDGNRLAYVDRVPGSAPARELWMIENVLTTEPLARARVTVAISTSASRPRGAGFAGYNVALMAAGIGYKDPQLAANVSALGAGWLRFPAGARSAVYDWRTGLARQEWADQFRQTPFAAQMQDAVRMLRAKGGERIEDAAALAAKAGARGLIVSVNVFTDTPESARALAEHVRANNIPVLVWQLGNEPTFFPAFFPEARSYAEKMRPFADAIRSVDPTALVSLSMGIAGNENAKWDSTLASVRPRYWDVVTYHQYPQVRGMPEEILASLNEVLASDVERRVDTYVRPLFGEMPIIITEAGAGSGSARPDLGMVGTLYGGVWAAEYATRLSRTSRVWHVGMHQLLGPAGLDLADDGRAAVLARPTAGDSMGDAQLDHGPFIGAQGAGYAVAAEAINAASATFLTTVTGGARASTRSGSPIPAVHAQAYRMRAGSALVVTNKSGVTHQLRIVVDGKPVDARLDVVEVTGADPTVRNAVGQGRVARRAISAIDTVAIGPWSVTRISWR